MTFAPRTAADQAAWEAIHGPIEELRDILGSRGFAMFGEGDIAAPGESYFLEHVTPLIVRDVVAMLVDTNCAQELMAAFAPYLVAEFATAPHQCSSENQLWRAQELLEQTVPAMIAPEEDPEEAAHA